MNHRKETAVKIIRSTIGAAALVAVFALTGCGSGSDASSPADSGSSPQGNSGRPGGSTRSRSRRSRPAWRRPVWRMLSPPTGPLTAWASHHPASTPTTRPVIYPVICPATSPAVAQVGAEAAGSARSRIPRSKRHSKPVASSCPHPVRARTTRTRRIRVAGTDHSSRRRASTVGW